MHVAPEGAMWDTPARLASGPPPPLDNLPPDLPNKTLLYCEKLAVGPVLRSKVLRSKSARRDDKPPPRPRDRVATRADMVWTSRRARDRMVIASSSKSQAAPARPDHTKPWGAPPIPDHGVTRHPYTLNTAATIDTNPKPRRLCVGESALHEASFWPSL